MATAVLTVDAPTLTIEEYLQTSYRPDCDFVDGHLEERNLGEQEHGELQLEVGRWFGNRRQEWKIRVATEYRTRVSPNRIRIPDVAVYPNDGAAEKVRVTPPLICIEILSPEDRLSRVIVRLEEFLTMGVPNIWLFDPEERKAFTYTRDGLRLVSETRIEVAGSPIYIDLVEVFSALD